MTLPERRHRVQTRIRFAAPLMSARTGWRFGSNRRRPTLWACETVRPATGPFPQISHRFAIIVLLSQALEDGAETANSITLPRLWKDQGRRRPGGSRGVRHRRGEEPGHQGEVGGVAPSVLAGFPGAFLDGA